MKLYKLRLIVFAAAVAGGLVACGSTAATATPVGTPTAAPVVTVAPATPTLVPTPTETPSPSSTLTAPPSALGLAGSWNGTWKDTSPDTSSGTFTVAFVQTSNNLTGTIVVKGTPCLTNGTVTGTLTGGSIRFGAVSGLVTITYDGTISGGTMQGTYAAPACGQAKGNWSATKA
jgi:hypothetical protein